MQITALEQLKGEMQEELFQQSVDNTKLHSLNQQLTAQLAKAEDRIGSLQANITALSDDKLKVTQCCWLPECEACMSAEVQHLLGVTGRFLCFDFCLSTGRWMRMCHVLIIS